MGHQTAVRLQETCLHPTPIVPHDQKIIPQSLVTARRDIIHHDHRKMPNIDHIREDDLKVHRTIFSLIHLTLEDHIDVLRDEIRTHQSLAGR